MFGKSDPFSNFQVHEQKNYVVGVKNQNQTPAQSLKFLILNLLNIIIGI